MSFTLTTDELKVASCGNIASICAGHIVSILGPRSKTSLSSLIKVGR